MPTRFYRFWVLFAVLFACAVSVSARTYSSYTPVNAVVTSSKSGTITVGTIVYFSSASSTDKDSYDDPQIVDDTVNNTAWQYSFNGGAWTTDSTMSGHNASKTFDQAGIWKIRALVDDVGSQSSDCSDDYYQGSDGDSAYLGSYPSNAISFVVVGVGSAINGPTVVKRSTNATFYGTSNPSGYTSQLSWSGGDQPASASSIGYYTTKWNNSAGAKTITMSCGSSSLTKPVTVIEPTSITGPSEVAIGTNGAFSSGTNPTGYNQYLSWTGGGSPASLSNSTSGTFTTQWSSSGTKTITLSCGTSVTKSVTVVDATSITGPTAVAKGTDATYTGTSNPTGYPQFFSWSDGGDPASQTGGGTFTTRWDTPGQKTVKLSCGSTTKTANTTVVAADSCDGPDVVLVGQEAEFTATTNPCDQDYSSLLSWSGGGDPAGQSGVSTYKTHWDTPGEYTVTLTCGTSTASRTVAVVGGEVKAVTFITPEHGMLCSDSGIAFSPRGWSSAGNNPVSYSISTNARAIITCGVKPSGHTYSLDGAGGSWLDFSADDLPSSDEDVSFSKTATNSLPSYIDVINQNIDWTGSNLGATYGGTLDMGSSGSHKVYVTLAQPTASPLYETLLHVTCNAAKGCDTASAAEAAIWGKFASKSVETVGGTLLKYYGNGLDTPGNGSTSSLLQNSDGRCGEWAAFYIDCMKSQGIGGGKIMHMNLLSHTMIENGNEYRSDAFLMNTALTGQGSTFPPFRFQDHAAVIPDTTAIYDPSYGVGPYTTFLDYINDVICCVVWVNKEDPNDVIYKSATDEDFFVSIIN